MELIFKKLHRYFCGKWRLAVFDPKSGCWPIKLKHLCIPYLKAENANGRHIFMQPDSSIAPYYLMLDDITSELINRHHLSRSKFKPGRLIVETSPANYQVWIHSCRPLSLEVKQYWLTKLRSDPGAAPKNRWGRCPGFRNRKPKYEGSQGGFPLSKLIWIDWNRVATIPDNPLKIISSPQPVSPSTPRMGRVCNSKDISRSNYQRGNESATDFSFILALLYRGVSEEVIKHRIITERENWGNHSGKSRLESYLNRSIRNAKLKLTRSKK